MGLMVEHQVHQRKLRGKGKRRDYWSSTSSRNVRPQLSGNGSTTPAITSKPQITKAKPQNRYSKTKK